MPTDEKLSDVKGRYPVSIVKPSSSDQKCRISENIFESLVSNAGYTVEKVPREVDSGVDFHMKPILSINGSRCDGSIFLDFQIKSTENWCVKEKQIKYRLKAKNYNHIVYRNIMGDVPIILILFCFSKNRNWVNVNHRQINFYDSIYYHIIEDKEMLELQPDSSKVIYVPRNNLLTETKLVLLINKYLPKVAR